MYIYLWLLLALASTGGWIAYIYWWKPAVQRFYDRLPSLQPEVIKEDAYAKSLNMSLNVYDELCSTGAALQEKVKGLAFPTAPTLQEGAKSDKVMEDLVKILDNNSPYVAGAEQWVFQFFPPHQLGDFLLHVVDTIGSHGSQTLTGSMTALRTSIHEGMVNVQEHPELLKDCIRNVFTSLQGYLRVPSNAEHFFHHIGNHHYMLAFAPIVNVQNLYDWLDPLMHTHQHAGEIGHSVATHAGHAAHFIAHHVHAIHHLQPGAHFPYVTLVLSGVREYNLLQEEKTDMATSFKNISLDVAGTGLGALGGAKGGAAAGTFICPGIGTLIGGIVGAIGGAIAGRYWSDEIKKKDLADAIGAFEAAYWRIEIGLETIARTANQAVNKSIEENRYAYWQQIGPAPVYSGVKEEVAELIYRLASTYRSDIDQCRQLILKAKRSIFARFGKAKLCLHEMEARLNEIEAELPVRRQISFDPVRSLRQLSRISYLQGGEYPGEVEVCDRLLKRMNTDRKTMLLLWAGHAAVVYNDCIQQIVKELTTQAELYNKACGESRTLLDQHIYTINKEKSKLGYA